MQRGFLLCVITIAALPAVLSNPEPSLPTPTNVRIESYNLQHVVRWDAVEAAGETTPVKYNVGFEMDSQMTGTAEQNFTHSGRYSEFRELCVNITETECNFTGKILSFFRGKLMVRAEVGSRRSDWVVMPDFQPSRNTTIGPVKLLILRSHSGKLTVDFSPPFSPIPSGWAVKYNLSYWKEHSENTKTIDLNSATTYLLDGLEPNARYCAQVNAFTDFIKGLLSDPVCQTMTTEITLIVVLGCIFAFVLIFAIISLFIIPGRPLYKAISRMKNWLDGPYRIPSDILEYLEDPPSSSVFPESPRDTPNEQSDHVSILELDLCLDVNEEISPDRSQQGSEKT